MTAHIHHALRLDGPTQDRALSGDAAIAQALREPAPAWLHLRADHANTRAWTAQHLDFLDPQVRSALLAPDTRPRMERIDDGVLLILRGLNDAPDAEPDDMVSLRLWIEPARVISLSRRPLGAIDQLAARISQTDTSGETAAGLLHRLLDAVLFPLDAHLRVLEDLADTTEDRVIAGEVPGLRAQIADQRRDLVDLRRYLGPQRDAIGDLAKADLPWLGRTDRRRLGETRNRATRVVEVLDSLREQLHLQQEDVSSQRAERLNRNLYVLSLVSVVFLPLGFLTGLMGVNLAGMPGASWTGAFWAFVGILSALGLAIAAALLVLFRR